MDLQEQCERLAQARKRIEGCCSLAEKGEWIEKDAIVQDYFSAKNPIQHLLSHLSAEEKWVVFSLVFLGQGPVVFNTNISSQITYEKIKPLLRVLLDTETFYAPIGGVLGYHEAVIREILSQKEEKIDESISYRQPVPYTIEEKNRTTRQAITSGIASVPMMGEVFVVGGAGDRLDLQDAQTGKPLPAAVLPFMGRSLLAGLVRDLQAREYLHYKCTGEKCVTPVVVMTSLEKDNHAYIQRIFSENNWFGRPSMSFFFLIQPLAPVITCEGNWSLQAPLSLTLKPGGHGVLWKLASDQGAFTWLQSQNRKKILVRQINNPVAGTDDGLLAFTGTGCQEDKEFGFAACPRRLFSAEGTDVLVEKKEDGHLTYALSNIEYVHFAAKGITDQPAKAGDENSAFPANTNILFADIDTVKRAAEENPFPGLLVNLKKTAPYINPQGEKTELPSGRLESTMQNISDHLTTIADHPLKEEEIRNLPVFLTYNARNKTIAVTKNLFKGEGNLSETCDGAFRTVLRNHWELFVRVCQWDLPPIESEEEYLQQGPSFFLDYHPALGPLYSIVGQKVRKGTMSWGSECILEIVDLDLEEVSVDGSLRVMATDPLGNNPTGEGGKCTLRHVEIRNRGIDRTQDNLFWRGEIHRNEGMTLLLHGNAEFFAEDVVFQGNQRIEVPAGHRCVASQGPDFTVIYHTEPLSANTWKWDYFLQEDEVILQKKAKSLLYRK